LDVCVTAEEIVLQYHGSIPKCQIKSVQVNDTKVRGQNKKCTQLKDFFTEDDDNNDT
jgi:hypothetical protein